MTSEAYKAFLRDHEEYSNPGSTHAEAPRPRQSVEPRPRSSRRSFLDDALTDRSKSDRLRARRQLHSSPAHHDRGRRNTDKQAYVKEEDLETGALHRWEPDSDKNRVHGRAEGIGEKLAPRPKQENRILSQESVTTNNEARNHHEKDRRTVHGERERDTLEDHGLTKDYIDGFLSGVDEQHERRLRNWMMADIKRQLKLQTDLQERAVREATDLNSIMARIRRTSRRATSTPESQKPGASSSTRAQASSTSSTSHVSRDQGEDGHKNFESRQSYAHRTTRGLYKEEEEGKREEIQENHRKWYEDCREKAMRDAAALGSGQTSRPQPIIANGMNSARTAASHPKDRKPSASSRTRPQVSPIRSTPDVPSVRSAGSDYTTRERKTVVEQSPLIYYSHRPDGTSENLTIRSGSRPCSQCGNKSQKPHYIDAACQTDASLAKAVSANKQPSLSREDVAKGFDFWI